MCARASSTVGDFLLVVGVKKEKNPAPQAPASGREGDRKGEGGTGGSLAPLTAFGGPRGAGYEVIDESKLRRKRTCEAEKSPKKAVVRAYSRSDHGTMIAGRRNRHGAAAGGATRFLYH